MQRFLLTVPVMAFLVGSWAASPSFAVAKVAVKPTVLHDEAKQGDFGPTKPEGKVTVRVSKPGVHVILGTGIDAIDDVDAFVFEVTGELPFDFCLIADAAEFKKLRSIDAKGKVTEIAFGSTNPRFGVPRNISKAKLPPGKYHVEMMFGPQAALGDWIVKIAPHDGEKPIEGFCKPPIEPTTAQKMKKVDWPGAISIFHGHNWGKDAKYPIAIKEAGFGASGAAEWQIKECEAQGLRSFVFIWPHEVGTIPVKHKTNKSVLCYYLSDRIKPNKWASWASLEKMAYKSDPARPAFFTMRGLWGGIEGYCPTVRGRVMEYYHYHWDGNRGPHQHFALLEQYRQASAKNGYVPICRIVETRPEDMRKTRQTIYTCLAYGVRGFRTGGRGIFDTSKRDARGVPTRTAFGEEFKKINAAIKAYSPVYKKARSQAVYHTAPLPAGCIAAPKDSWVKIEGKEVLVGVFAEPAADGKAQGKTVGTDYLLVANRDAFKAHAAALSLRGAASVERMDKTTGKWQAVKTTTGEDGVLVKLSLEEGSGELLRVIRKK
jgi:hypothetical protein